MAVQAQGKAEALGAGSLKFGKTGSEKEFSFQCSEVKLEPETKVGDSIELLGGNAIAGDVERSFKLTGKIYQEYSSESLLIWAKENDGKTMPFIFKPKNTGNITCKGEVIVTALEIGGDVKKQNTSDFEFTGVGDWSIEKS